MDGPVPEKLDIFRINISSAFLAKHAWRSNMLSVACFHGLRKEVPGTIRITLLAHTHEKKERKETLACFRVSLPVKQARLLNQPFHHNLLLEGVRERHGVFFL